MSDFVSRTVRASSRMRLAIESGRALLSLATSRLSVSVSASHAFRDNSSPSAVRVSRWPPSSSNSACRPIQEASELATGFRWL